MKNKIGTVISIIALILIIALIGYLGYGYYKKATMQAINPVATMEVEGYGTVKMELYPEYAPNTVNNFIALANRGFYDGTTFHRIVKDFMVQAGANEDGTSKETKLSNIMNNPETDKEYTIKGEFISNGFNQNTLKHEEGTVAMARADYTQTYSPTLSEESYNSASSQFFIVTQKQTSLDGYYAPFGKVIEGMDIVHKIENAEVKPAEKNEDGTEGEASTPVDPPVIKSIRVDTFGENYDLPETMDPFDYYTWMYETYGIDPSTFAGGTDTIIPE